MSQRTEDEWQKAANAIVEDAVLYGPGVMSARELELTLRAADQLADASGRNLTECGLELLKGIREQEAARPVRIFGESPFAFIYRQPVHVHLAEPESEGPRET